LNENIGILLDKHIKDLKSEDKFWKEFIKNQKENESEIIGGLKQIYYTNQESNFAETEKAKIQKENQKQLEQGKSTNIFNNLRKIGKKFEIYEKFSNYSHKNYGISLNVNEFDFKDKEIKMLNFEEPADRKEITNFIENLNDYSSRKLPPNSYINKRFCEIKGKKFQLQSNVIQQNYSKISDILLKSECNGINLPLGNKNVAENYHPDSYDLENHHLKSKENIEAMHTEPYSITNGGSINNSLNMNNTQNNHTHGHNKKPHSFSKKLNEMKHNYLLEKAHHNKDITHDTMESLEIFNKLNEATIKAPKQTSEKMRREDYNSILEIFNKHEIIKDIYTINNYIKCSNYNDHMKTQKRSLVRSLTNDIEIYRSTMKVKQNLHSAVKANLDLLNSFLNKIKPNSANQGSTSTNQNVQMRTN